uniref:Transmembrane protein 170A n=1 Tax=Erpetoichthys calabaricus TaxID=27687 RepID=A0A8C4S299_ERPCA
IIHKLYYGNMPFLFILYADFFLSLNISNVLAKNYLHLFISEMWYGVFQWALVSSLVVHIPASLLSLYTLRRHKYARFIPVAVLLMSILGPVCGGMLTSAAIAGVYKAAGKGMVYLEALILGIGQTFCVVVISFLRVLATL